MSQRTDHYGPMVSGHEVEFAFTEILRIWLPSYICHVQNLYGYTALPAIRSVSVWPEDLPDGFPEHQLPHLSIAMPGMSEEPLKEGSGNYRATFEFGVAVVCSANGQAATRKLAFVYALAVQGAVLHHRSLGGFARGVDFVGMRPMSLDDKVRSLAAQITVFRVEVDDVMSVNDGPLVPSEDPCNVAGFPYIATVGTTSVKPVP